MFISPNLSRSFSRIPFSPINARRSLFGDDGRPQFLFEADDDKNPGGDNNQSQNPPNQPNIEDAVDKRIAQLLGSKKANNDPMEALAISVKAQNRLETEVERLKSGQMNEADRERLQSANDLLSAYEAKDFTELKAKLDSGISAIQERDMLHKMGTRNEALEASGFDAKKVALLNGLDAFEFETKVEKQGKDEMKAGRAKGKLPDGSDFDGTVSELLNKIAAPMVESLKAVQVAPSTPHPRQSSGGEPLKSEPSEEARQSQARATQRAF